jgi:hypothetical protein
VLVPSRDDFYEFRHALLAEAVYDDLLPGERTSLHAAYATALQDGRATGTAAELARHARLAKDYATALTASLRAGDDARERGRRRGGRPALPPGPRAVGRHQAPRQRPTSTIPGSSDWSPTP